MICANVLFDPFKCVGLDVSRVIPVLAMVYAAIQPSFGGGDNTWILQVAAVLVPPDNEWQVGNAATAVYGDVTSPES